MNSTRVIACELVPGYLWQLNACVHGTAVKYDTRTVRVSNNSNRNLPLLTQPLQQALNALLHLPHLLHRIRIRPRECHLHLHTPQGRERRLRFQNRALQVAERVPRRLVRIAGAPLVRERDGGDAVWCTEAPGWGGLARRRLGRGGGGARRGVR